MLLVHASLYASLNAQMLTKSVLEVKTVFFPKLKNQN